MTQTEELRAMLDARSIEHSDNESATRHVTIWQDNAHRAVEASEVTHSNCGLTVHVYHMTAEQAMQATLGRGTCHTVSTDCFGNPPYNQSGLNGNSMACGCSECGAPWSTCGMFRGNRLKHNFKACPNCGRKVEEWMR